MDMTTPAAEPAAAAVSAASPMPSASLRRANRWAQAGYALIPSVAGALVAIPVVAICWSVLLRHQQVTAYHAWFLLCLIPAALVILSAWVRFEKPEGLRIEATDAPALFALVEQVRAYMGAPAIDGVYLTDRFVVRAAQRPVHGLFGGFRTDIIVGLPVLQSVSKAEAAVLIAHELGHMSSREGAMAAEVHRARVMWQHLIERQPRQPLYLQIPFRLVTGAFARKFLAISASQERAAVFAADLRAADVAGLGNVGSALQRLRIAEQFLADYRRQLEAEPVTSQEPRINPHREAANFLPRMAEWERATEVLERALAESGDRDPAHPTLAERLDALHLIAEVPQAVGQPAAQLLGPALDKALDHFDAAWRAEVGPAWRAAYDKLSPEAKRLLDLDALAVTQALDLAPAIERARLAYFGGGLAEARGRYADLIEWHPEDGRAVLAAGIAMIDGGEADGTEFLRHALELAPRTDWNKANADEWFAVGEALLAAHDDLGIDCLEQAIRIDPMRADMAAFLVDRYLDAAPGAANAA